MNKLFFVLMLYSTFSAVAQERKKLWIGARVGLHAAQLISSSADKSSQIICPSAGLTGEYKFSFRFSLNVELAYAKLGGRYHTPFSSNNATFTRQFDQTTIPIFLRYYPNASHFFIEAGGQLGYVLSDRISFDQPGNGSLTDYNKLNRVDGGLIVGAGYKFSDHIGLSLRFFKGGIPIYPSYTSTDPTTGLVTTHEVAKITNQFLGLNVTYYF